MLNRLLVIAAILALIASVDTAAASPVEGVRYFAVAGDTVSKSKDKQVTKKKTDKSKAARTANPAASDNLVEPEQAEEDDEGQEQVWETELFVNQDPSVTGEVLQVIAK